MASTAAHTGVVKWRWPHIEARAALQLLAFFLAIATLQGLAEMFAWREEGGADQPLLPPLARQLTGAVATWLSLPVVQLAARNAPGPAVGWFRLGALHIAGYLCFTACKSTIMLAMRWAAEPLVTGISSSRPLLLQVLWEAQLDIVLYGCLAAFWILLSAWEERREAVLHAARLDAQLASARLDALTAQVNPHFLFNALNTVSSTMYEDLPHTERLLSSLGQILRATLAQGGVTWSLAEERGHTERYIELLLARFGDQLSVRWEGPPGVEQERVPRFAIQTLVENAVKHNQDREQPLAVTITCAREGAVVRVAVEDDGRGFGPRAGERAGALGRLRETLRLLHGERAQLSLAGAPGARVELRFPAAAAADQEA
jgi:two-component system, LytTR family, sensor kinase